MPAFTSPPYPVGVWIPDPGKFTWAGTYGELLTNYGNINWYYGGHLIPFIGVWIPATGVQPQ